MSEKVGRNDPCPCGSGKKYKHCCIGREGAESPMLRSRTGDEAFRRYREIALPVSRSSKKSSPAANRRTPSAHAAEALHTITDKMGKREFRSEKELKKFMNRNLAAINNAPHKDFLGLSPAQLHAIIQKGFEEENDVVSINRDVAPELLESAPAMVQCRYLLREIAGDGKGIKTTQKGNLPRAQVQRFYDLFVREHDTVPVTPVREDEVKGIQRARFFLDDSGYITFRHGGYIATDRGMAALENPAPELFYRELFLYNARRYNWLYGTRYPDVLALLQQTLVFDLHIIRNRAKNFVLGETLALQYRKAFPSLADEMASEHGDLFLRAGFCHIFLDEFAYYLGLLEREGGENRYFSREFRFKTTPLFKKLFTWKV